MNLLRLLPTPSTAPPCEHVPAATPDPLADYCQECGSTVSLRLCATCGHVGCCESQAGHARAHAMTADHPVIHQMPAAAGFTWCYADRSYVERRAGAGVSLRPDPAPPARGRRLGR